MAGLLAVTGALESYPRTRALLEAGVADGTAPGFVAGVWSKHDPLRAQIWATGSRSLIPARAPMLVDTTFDLASVTKVMATATLAAVLVQRGWLDWDTPVCAILPEVPYGPEVRVSHLLSHTAGFVAWHPFWEELRARFRGLESGKGSVAERQRMMRKLVFAVKPESRPGARALYSDVSFLTLGFLLEALVGQSLDRAVPAYVWRPLGLEFPFYVRTDRGVEAGRRLECAATEDCAWRGGVLQGQVHDDNAWAMGGYAGHAGVFGRAIDVLTFGARLYEGRLLGPAILHQMWTRVSEPPGCERTLGWDTPSAVGSRAGSRFWPGSVGHWGFTGTSLWIDRRAGLVITLLSNRVHPSREHEERIRTLRPRFFDTLRAEMPELWQQATFAL